MIIMVGNRICKDCVAAMAVIERERLPIEFHDMSKSLDYVKEFLKIREGNEALYAEAREYNQIGIPVFVLEDGTVTMDCDAAYEAARKAKAPTAVMFGSQLCWACREKLEMIREKNLPVEFHDILEDLDDMRQYLKIRESHPEIYDRVREEGRVGIPVFILPDGTVTNDFEQVQECLR